MSSDCVLRVTSEYSFTDLGRMDCWVDCWFVVSGSNDGFEPPRVDLTWFETLRLNHSATPPFRDDVKECQLHLILKEKYELVVQNVSTSDTHQSLEHGKFAKIRLWNLHSVANQNFQKSGIDEMDWLSDYHIFMVHELVARINWANRLSCFTIFYEIKVHFLIFMEN